jgi:hypothetical protein
MNKCNLFEKDPTFSDSPYRVQSPVSLSIFCTFVSALEGNAINITDRNLTELTQFCEEFVFTEIAAKLSEFRPSMDFKEGEAKAGTEDADARGRIAAREEKANPHSHVIAMLQDKVAQLSTDFVRLAMEVSALRLVSAGIQTLSEEVSALERQIGEKLNDRVVEHLSTEFNELRKEVLTPKARIAAMSPTVIPSQTCPCMIQLRVPHYRASFRSETDSVECMIESLANRRRGSRYPYVYFLVKRSLFFNFPHFHFCVRTKKTFG